MVLYHKNSCSGKTPFMPHIMTNRAGMYIGMMCSECLVSTRESGYYDNAAQAMSDLNLWQQGLPITNPYPEEGEEEDFIRHLKAAGLDPQPDESNDLLPSKPARVLVAPDGKVDIMLEDPLGAVVQLQIAITPWGLVCSSTTGFNVVNTEDAFMLIMPESEHVAENLSGLDEEVERIKQAQGEVEEVTPTIDT